MKVVFITDTHWGARLDNPYFYDYQKKFLDNVFFPYLDYYNISHVVHLGDLVDNRTKLNYMTKKRLREDFLEPLKNLETVWIVGNHDAFYKNTLEVNAASEVVDTGIVVDGIRTINFGRSFSFLCVPWICSDNRAESISRISESSARLVLGHLELKGFRDNSGNFTNYGDDPSIYEKFDQVYSGHFHKRSKRGNIAFLGAAFEYTWADAGDFRGFAVYDTDLCTISYIRNPYNLFRTVSYNEEISDEHIDSFKGTYTRLLVKECASEVHLKDTIKKIEDVGVIDLTVLDERSMVTAKVGEVIQSDDIRASFHGYINKNTDEKLITSVKEKFDSIYSEAEKECN